MNHAHEGGRQSHARAAAIALHESAREASAFLFRPCPCLVRHVSVERTPVDEPQHFREGLRWERRDGRILEWVVLSHAPSALDRCLLAALSRRRVLQGTPVARAFSGDSFPPPHIVKYVGKNPSDGPSVVRESRPVDDRRRKPRLRVDPEVPTTGPVVQRDVQRGQAGHSHRETAGSRCHSGGD